MSFYWLGMALFWLAMAAAAFTAGFAKTIRPHVIRREVPAKPCTPARAPADASRPWLRTRADLDNPHDGRLSVCPICGMPDAGNLDAYHLGGWPAHSECKEWLGDWKPPAWLPRVPERALEREALATTLKAMLEVGAISPGEYRERRESIQRSQSSRSSAADAGGANGT